VRRGFVRVTGTHRPAITSRAETRRNAMKPLTLVPATLALAFAAASSPALADTKQPPINKTSPAKPEGPKVANDFANPKKPGVVRKKYKCYSNCSVFESLCTDVGGTISKSSDGGTVCTTKD
jgi:hypothetical protein